MNYKISIFLLFILFVTNLLWAQSEIPIGLKVENQTEPLNIDIRVPTFEWRLKTSEKGIFQKAFQIIVSSSRDKAVQNIGDIWNTGKITSSTENNVQFEGTPLKSEEIYYWKIRTWNQRNDSSQWSDISRFATGMLKISEWQGRYIGKRDYQLYRKEFKIVPDRKIESALLYVGSWGVPVVYLNGYKVSDIVLNTADCVLRKTTWYRGFDVTKMIHAGNNAVGVMMGDGLLGREDGDPSDLRFILNIMIHYSDGSKEVISSDGSWKATKNGPLISEEKNNVMDGEKYDARIIDAESQWSGPGFNDDNWELADMVLNVCEPENTLKAQTSPPMKVMESITPKSINEVMPQVYIVDAGKNLTGWAKIKADGKPGDKVEMRFADQLSKLWNNYCFIVTVKVVKGSAGILFRAANQDNYYCWKVNSRNIIATKKQNGQVSILKDIPLEKPGSGEYHIKITAIGSKIQTYLDDKIISTVADETMKSGKVGFYEDTSDMAIYSDIKLIAEPSGKVLLQSSGKNPDLWMNNKNVQVTNGKLEVENSPYVVSTFGNVDGDIDQTSLSVAGFVPDVMGTGAMQYDYYIHGPNGIETWEPFQTIHGFQYIEVKGFNNINKDNLKVQYVYATIDENEDNLGSFRSSDTLLNKLYDASLSSIVSAMQWGAPASCVTRDERGGWTGDGECTSQAANYYADMVGIYKQWFVDMRETQHSDGYIDNLAPRQGERAGAIEEDIPWSSAVINVTWDTYWASGDKSIIREQYDAMKRFIHWCENTSNAASDSLEKEDYTSDKDCWGDYGSPLEIKDCCPVPMPQKSLYATAFFYNSTKRLSVLANEIGKFDDSKQMNELAMKIKRAYNRKFLKEDENGAYYLTNTQTDNAVSVGFGLCPENKKQEVLNHLIESLKRNDYNLTVGILGLYGIFDALCDNGHANIAYKIVTKTSYPSWGYWIKKGATSMWEFWDGHGSHNHMFMGGKMNAFLVKNLAGISPLVAGYDRILIKPEITGDLKSIDACAYSPKGRIEVMWEKTTNGLQMRTVIPANSSAELHLPLIGNDDSNVTVKEGNEKIFSLGKGSTGNYVKFVKSENGNLIFNVESGTYNFSLTTK